MSKKVFLCTDTFMQQRNYYIVARNEKQAEELARQTPFPDYLDHDRDSHMEIVDCIVETCVAVITLVKISTLLDTSPECICLIPTTMEENTDAYQGYLVGEDNVDISIKRTYPKAEWQLVEGK